MADMLQYSSFGFDSSGSDSDPDTPIMEEQFKKDNSTESDDRIIKQQAMFIWNTEYEKWHECNLQLKPPYLHIQEYEDTMMEIQEKQLEHIHKRWFHGDISRREAKYILQDYSGGDGSFLVRTSESYSGKFAISFMHEGRVKHVVIETNPDPTTGVVYHITPNGPFFDSLSGLIEEAKNSCIIKNHIFEVVLTKSPPKPDQRWLHSHIKSLSQAEQLMRKEQLDGSFLVYQTLSDYAPYSLLYRSGGNIVHSSIMTSQRSSHGYTLNGVTAPVLYKLIHYYMENPIHGDTVLQYPVQNKDPSMSNCAIASEDFTGDFSKNELCFNHGALITNISRRSVEWCVGDHRGDRQKFFPTSAVWFLSKEELNYITNVKASFLESRCSDNKPNIQSHSLNLKSDYTIRFDNDTSTVIHILPSNPLISSFRQFKISCPSCHDVEQWYQTLEKNNCLSINKESDIQSSSNSTSRGKRNGRKKRGSCIIS